MLVSLAVAGLMLRQGSLRGSPAIAAPEAYPPPDPAAWHVMPHVRNYTFYGLNDINAKVPAAYMAAHASIVEDDGYTAAHANAFKLAGGELAIAYTDPTYDAHCPPPFTPPAGKCGGALGAPEERAYVHGADGERVHHFVDAYFQYQEVINPTQPAAREAYARWTASVLRASPLLDGFRADDSGSPFSKPGGELGSNLYEGYTPRGVEITSEAQYIAGETAMLAAARKPVLINGGDPRGTGPAYGGLFLDLPEVFGQMFEGSFNNDGNYLYADRKFATEENALLAVYAHRKLAVCMPTGDVTPPHRMYAYASWLLTYDPRYSVFATIEKQNAEGDALYPETELVPVAPRQTPHAIDDLRRSGIFVREFGACAIGGRPIGPCAAVVNPASHDGAAIPALSIPYAHHIELDAQSLYRGGRARVVSGAPAALAPETAAILVR
jgi:hypothetical protein